MSKYFLQMEYGPAAPEIVHRERMPECVERASGRFKAKVRQRSFTLRKIFLRLNSLTERLAKSRSSGLRSWSLKKRTIALRNSSENGTTRCLRPLPSSVAANCQSRRRATRAPQRCGSPTSKSPVRLFHSFPRKECAASRRQRPGARCQSDFFTPRLRDWLGEM